MQPCGFAGLTAFARSYRGIGMGRGLGWVRLEVEWGVWSWSCQSSWIAVRSMRTAEEDACHVVLAGVVESCVGELVTSMITHHYYWNRIQCILPSFTLPRNDHCVGLSDLSCSTSCQMYGMRCMRAKPGRTAACVTVVGL